MIQRTPFTYLRGTRATAFPRGCHATIAEHHSMEIDILDVEGYYISGVQFYTLRNSATQYLMIIDTRGENGRFFRSFTTIRFGGIWILQTTSESNPFASKGTISVSQTTVISRADVIRRKWVHMLSLDESGLQLVDRRYDPGTFKIDVALLSYQPAYLALRPIQLHLHLYHVADHSSEHHLGENHDDHEDQYKHHYKDGH
jgi:hypothetical protein